MDDFSVASLVESKNEWCARLVSIFTPAVIAGLRSIFEEAVTLCKDNNEEDKYLLTFQTFLRRIPKWNSTIIQTEQKRITETSGCGYLEDLVTCVHIIQLKALTCIRVGQEQKKVSVNIPSLEQFVHQIYIATARKIYANVYLFDADAAPLQIQKHNRELELIVRECILDTIRSSMPVEELLRSYLSETEEENTEVREEIIERQATNEEMKENNNSIEKNTEKDIYKETDSDIIPDNTEINDVKQTENIEINIDTIKNSEENDKKSIHTETDTEIQNLTFSDVDKAINTNGVEIEIDAPKTIERLEKISQESNDKRKAEEAEDDDYDDDTPLKIGEEVKLDFSDVNDLNKPIAIDDTPILEIENL